MPPATDDRAWRSRAFGIEIEGDFPAPGLPPATGETDGPLTRVRVVPEAEIEERWDPAAAERLVEERFDDSPEAARSIDRVAGTGYRLYARHFGLAFVSEDGAEILCAPPEDEPWSWQRFLVGRTLPWAAVLRGRELFHASAVAIDGRVIAIIGPSGAGKTSLATHLVLGGARFVTDDVLALESRGNGISAHPGAAILCLREQEIDAMPAGLVERIGDVLGESGKTYVEVAREERARPLAALYFLRPADASAIEPIERPGPTLLLASTFISSIRSPERLRRQFELVADLAARVPLFGLSVGPDDGAAALAKSIRSHAAAL